MGRPVGVRSCVIAVGEGLQLDPALEVSPNWAPTLVERMGARTLQAKVPGRTVLRGLRTAEGPIGDLAVEVVEVGDPSLTPLVPQMALRMAHVAVAQARPAALPAPAELPQAVGELAELALIEARRADDDEAIVAHFQRLVAVQPSTALELPVVARVARAMQATGRMEDASRVWRAGLDAAFRAEAARLDPLGRDLGVLARSRLIRDAALRYPRGRAVGDALYLLPNELWSMVDGEADEAIVSDGISALDLRLTAAAWDRELLALNPRHPKAPAAGLRLARSLLSLRAFDAAALWAERVGRAHPNDPLTDALLYVRALALSEVQERGAEPLLRKLIDASFPGADGVLQPSVHQMDARLVLGRLREARGDVKGALAAYQAVQASVPEAARSVRALTRQVLRTDPLVQLAPGEDVQMELEVQGIDSVNVRAYAVDLRTIFLRDGGLSGVSDIAVAGVSPAWSGRRRIDQGSFLGQRTIGLPLGGLGAWLVHLEHEGQRATSLVVRSALDMSISQSDGIQRITVQRGRKPASQVEVRALTRSGVQALTTDVRGVVEVAAGAPVLVFDEESVAFTEAGSGGAPPSVPAPRPSLPLNKLDQRLDRQRARDQESYRRTFQSDQAEEMSLEAF